MGARPFLGEMRSNYWQIDCEPSAARGPAGRPVQCRRRRSGYRLLDVVEAEADLEPDLEVGDLAVLDLPPDLRHLEPVEVAQRPAGARHTDADHLLQAIGGAAFVF